MTVSHALPGGLDGRGPEHGSVTRIDVALAFWALLIETDLRGVIDSVKGCETPTAFTQQPNHVRVHR
jgi:hypothetical protein